jgi:4-amino-4-deoxy-L-arabinose transferase-like glycosyltransferase
MRILPAVVAPRRYIFPALVTGVLALAAFNLGFRLDREFVREWDESLYATTAWEMQRSGEWIGTTYRGALDYYNTKPPLNVWLIAASFKAFGVGLVPLRLATVLAAWCTVAVLVWWTRKAFGGAVSLASGLVLSTTFAFFYGHAARAANTDALNTLLIVLTVVVLWHARDARWRLLWLGPILAAVFLLRGMAILMPIGVILVCETWAGHLRRDRLLPALGAIVLCLVPVGAWMFARWRLDGWQFLGRLFWYDFIAASTSTIEGHFGPPLYYLRILAKHEYEWLLAAGLAWLLYPVARERLRALRVALRSGSGPIPVVAGWGLVTLLIPTLMQTKLPWYLHAFYPVFAIGAGAVLAQAWERARVVPGGWRSRRSVALAVLTVLTLGIAEGKLIWYSYHHRDLPSSTQGLLLSARDELRGRSVFGPRWDRAQMFVIDALIGATPGLAVGVPDFLRRSQPGDFLMLSHEVSHPALVLAGTVRRHRLYKRIE